MTNVSLPTGQNLDAVNAGKTVKELEATKAKGLLTTEEKRYVGTRKGEWSHFCFSMVHSHRLLLLLFRSGVGGNASAHISAIMSDRKMEKSDEVGKIAKVDKSLCKAIMQARTAKKMTQKDLATAISVKPQVMAKYETGKAVPDPQMIGKLERKLGCKLPRPGANASSPKKTTTTSGGKSKADTSGGVTGKKDFLTREPNTVSTPLTRTF
jgi:putative transcription factor